MDDLARDYASLVQPGYAFVFLHVEPIPQKLPTAPVEDVEGNFAFGRHIEQKYGVQVF